MRFVISTLLLLGLGLFMPGELQSQTLRILPLGNSITAGGMCTNGDIGSCTPLGGHVAVGYRKRLYELLDAAGYDFDFVGTETYGNARMSDPDCGGFGGIRDAQLAELMETGTSSHTGRKTPGPYMNTVAADVVLLHIGTNDILGADTARNDIDRILDAIDDFESDHSTPVMVFLARIISAWGAPCNTQPRVKAYNKMVEEVYSRRKAAGDQLILVNMECEAGLDYSQDMADQVHPNQMGYDKMGQAWFNAISAWMSVPMPIYDLIVETDGTPGASVSPDGLVQLERGQEQSIQVTSIPGGYEFAGWQVMEGSSVDLASPQATQTTVRLLGGDARIRARFAPITHSLTVDVEGEGSILADPDLAAYAYNTTVELTATPAEGYEFISWSGQASGSNNPLSVLMDGDKVIGARFAPITRQLMDVEMISLSGLSHKVGDALPVHIQVSGDLGIPYSLISGEIGGYELENFQRLDSVNYQAEAFIYEGGNSYGPGDAIPVRGLVLTDGEGMTPEYDQDIAESGTSIDASTPQILSMTVPNATFIPEELVELTVLVDEDHCVAREGTHINGVELNSDRLSFEALGQGAYRLTYRIDEKDPAVEEGKLEAVVVLADSAGNVSESYSDLMENTLSISIAVPVIAMPATMAISLYPQPASSFLVVDLGRKSIPEGRLELWDSRGRLLRTLQLPDNQSYMRLATESMAPGSYVLRFCSGKTILGTKPLLITR